MQTPRCAGGARRKSSRFFGVLFVRRETPGGSRNRRTSHTWMRCRLRRTPHEYWLLGSATFRIARHSPQNNHLPHVVNLRSQSFHKLARRSLICRRGAGPPPGDRDTAWRSAPLSFVARDYLAILERTGKRAPTGNDGRVATAPPCPVPTLRAMDYERLGADRLPLRSAAFWKQARPDLIGEPRFWPCGRNSSQLHQTARQQWTLWLSERGAYLTPASTPLHEKRASSPPFRGRSRRPPEFGHLRPAGRTRSSKRALRAAFTAKAGRLRNP